MIPLRLLPLPLPPRVSLRCVFAGILLQLSLIMKETKRHVAVWTARLLLLLLLLLLHRRGERLKRQPRQQRVPREMVRRMTEKYRSWLLTAARSAVRRLVRAENRPETAASAA